jgi:hypothetical protein
LRSHGGSFGQHNHPRYSTTFILRVRYRKP